MKPSTPISEVARMISRDAAIVLMFEPFEVQKACLEHVRQFIMDLEDQGQTLDPILLQESLDFVIHTVLVALGRTDS